MNLLKGLVGRRSCGAGPERGCVEDQPQHVRIKARAPIEVEAAATGATRTVALQAAARREPRPTGFRGSMREFIRGTLTPALSRWERWERENGFQRVEIPGAGLDSPL